MKNKIIDLCIYCFRIVFRLGPLSSDKKPEAPIQNPTPVVPMVLNFEEVGIIWKEIYCNYFNKETSINLQTVIVPPMVSPHTHDAIVVDDVSIADAYKSFANHMKLHDFYSYTKLIYPNNARMTEMEAWDVSDVHHVRQAKNASYVVWLPKLFTKASDVIHSSEDVGYQKGFREGHVTLLEHLLHLAYIIHTTGNFPACWDKEVVCLGTASGDYHPVVSFKALRYGLTLFIETKAIRCLYEVIPEKDFWTGDTKPVRDYLFSRIAA